MTEPVKTKSWIKINPPVFFGAGGLCLIFVLFTALFPQYAGDMFNTIQKWVVNKAGWFYILSVALFLIFVCVLAISDFGRIKLGPDHSEPDYTYGSWFAMLFSAGMGIGLMFFGVAEPVLHTMAPPTAEPGSILAAREAMKITFFHWGVHAWAIYAVVALSLAYFSFRLKLPLAIRSAFYPLIGERIYGPIGHAIDIFAVLGTIFGVATSLGLGVVQVNAGLNYLLDVPVSPWVQVGLIAGITGLATISVVLGLDGGIRKVSQLNLFLAVALLIFVVCAGSTVYLLQTYVQNIGYYLSGLVETTFNLNAYKSSDWLSGWTLFYWGWWIAWSPFVGMFIARISRGRTIREFVIGVLVVPVGFTFMWMTFFGNSAIHLVIDQGAASLADAASADASVALFQFFDLLPLSTIASTVAIILVITFFVTSSDSGSLVVDMLTSGGDEGASPVWQRIFWSVSEGVIAGVLLLAGGLTALQTATIASALPFTVVMLFMCWGLFKALQLEQVKKSSMQDAMLAPSMNRNAISWQGRLRRLVHQPDYTEVDSYMKNTVANALASVASEFSNQGLSADVKHAEDRMWISVKHGEEIDFFYSIHVKQHCPPSFAVKDESEIEGEGLRYYQAEVYLKEGGQGYDVMGWTTEQLIIDMIDQYEKHLHFLGVVRD